MSQPQKRPSEDVDHQDGRRSAPRPPRIRACAECKRHKIKCEQVPNELKCAKCLRSGNDCVPYNLNQRLLDEDATWKADAAVELAQLRSAVQRLLRHNKLEELDSSAEISPFPTSGQTMNVSPVNVVSENGCATMVVPPMDMTRDNSTERDSGDESGLVIAPMRSLYDLTRIRNLRSSARLKSKSNPVEEDFIAQGLVPQAEAEELFNRYMHDIHLYLWAGVLFPYDSLEAVRRHSTLLTAAVLTIAALHTPGRDDTLQRCYNIFVSLTYSACLSRPQNLDDIRALALAAFYLSNLSWKLSGIAVRNAVEMNMHQSFQKLMRGHEDQRDHVRLWYALYVCEHQFSIAYGRPPIIHEDVAIKNIEYFLDSPKTQPGDIRLGAQVTLFKILTEAYIAYGSDPEQPLTESDFQQLRLFNFAIEQWRLAWQARSADSAVIGSYPSKGVVLYYHFARFQLNSLALRALPPPSAAMSESLSYDRREAANIAISAATSTLTLIFEEPDLRRAMTAVPIFTHTMVAFCATFLLKMAKTWGGMAQASSPEWATEPVGLGLNFNITQVLSLSRRSVSFLAKVAENLNEKHLTRHIVHGINDLLKRLDDVGTPNNVATSVLPPVEAVSAQALDPPSSTATVDYGGVEGVNGYNMYDLIGSYGFGFDETFLGQGASTNLDFWQTDPF
ncbi:fungal-specific transcription factor-like protein [Dothidotthia symphoricarpi CBS 119687]|uniref:Fungal-specific transcription factor-like protein n=1 Tax=Dothidotthia symphoricarpi CBS 119687 TaxID=1392245 RepID=A0A6A6ALR9_9PLEO|nr:fungal-specific transcription factor-like protein [Dothidotthia symphoricarpi CBS 119687]KAF2132113.1 fungal-specific transcription factor-like protein [Dothidotthia symphoricarpi CBS 119687]